MARGLRILVWLVVNCACLSHSGQVNEIKASLAVKVKGAEKTSRVLSVTHSIAGGLKTIAAGSKSADVESCDEAGGGGAATGGGVQKLHEHVLGRAMRALRDEVTESCKTIDFALCFENMTFLHDQCTAALPPSFEASAKAGAARNKEAHEKIAFALLRKEFKPLMDFVDDVVRARKTHNASQVSSLGPTSSASAEKLCSKYAIASVEKRMGTLRKKILTLFRSPDMRHAAWTALCSGLAKLWKRAAKLFAECYHSLVLAPYEPIRNIGSRFSDIRREPL
eukprot:TRINITY_DN3701_c0_g1_i4.p1 TRINITY_DN3701_c0_g1~~TRINITY_DN3701_c0_g1_i4.p1  ORF type:complete len:280 (-),score=83.11 TRINITY_DN3701_c0_g1_i4:139-978(-)